MIKVLKWGCLVLLFISLLFSCSSGSEEVEIREKVIQEIRLTLIQEWGHKIALNENTLSSFGGNCSHLHYGLGGGSRNTWFSVDTLEIDFKRGSEFHNIDLGIKNPSGSEARTHPQYIGYIKLINHENENISVVFNKDYLEHTYDKKMIYFNSNVSEEKIKELFRHSSRSGDRLGICGSSILNPGLVKSTKTLSTVKATSTEVIPYNPENDLIKVGDIWGRYKVLGKEYLWY